MDTNGHNGQTLIKALSYSTCLATAITGAPQRGIVQSVFRAAANITFPANFLLSLNALDAPRVPNSLQLSAPGGTHPFSSFRVGMPVLLGAQRLHIEALTLSLDLTYCPQWHPKIVRPEQLNLAIIAQNSVWLTQHVAHLPGRSPYSHAEHPQGAYTGRFFGKEAGTSRSCVGTGGCGDEDAGALCLSGWGCCTSTKDKHKAPASPLLYPLSLHTPSPLSQKPTPEMGTGPWARMITPNLIQSCTTIQSMAQQLCGRGLGLTPTGDDILAGWMAANWLLHGAHPRLLMACQTILAVAERQTHLLSQCWLRYAAGGYVAEPIGLLLQALTRENEIELAAATQAVLALGATSGHDVIHGVLLGLAGLPNW